MVDRAEREEEHGDGKFLRQTPIALLAIAAVAGIMFVNGFWSNGRGDVAAISENIGASSAVSAPCADCGLVVAVRAVEAAANQSGRTYDVEVKMTDGSRRTVNQLSPGFDVGARVRVNGNALVPRS